MIHGRTGPPEVFDRNTKPSPAARPRHSANGVSLHRGAPFNVDELQRHSRETQGAFRKPHEHIAGFQGRNGPSWSASGGVRNFRQAPREISQSF